MVNEDGDKMKKSYLSIFIIFMLLLIAFFQKTEPTRNITLFQKQANIIYDEDLYLKDQALNYYSIDGNLVLHVSIQINKRLIEQDIVVSLFPKEVAELQKEGLEQGNIFRSEGIVLNLTLFEDKEWRIRYEYEIGDKQGYLSEVRYKVNVEPVKLNKNELKRVQNDQFPFPYIISYLNTYGEYKATGNEKREFLFSVSEWNYDIDTINKKNLRDLSYSINNSWRYGDTTEVKDLAPYIAVEYAYGSGSLTIRSDSKESFTYEYGNEYRLVSQVPIYKQNVNKEYYLKRIKMANFTGWYDHSQLNSDTVVGSSLSHIAESATDDSLPGEVITKLYQIIR